MPVRDYVLGHLFWRQRHGVDILAHPKLNVIVLRFAHVITLYGEVPPVYRDCRLIALVCHCDCDMLAHVFKIVSHERPLGGRVLPSPVIMGSLKQTRQPLRFTFFPAPPIRPSAAREQA